MALQRDINQRFTLRTLGMMSLLPSGLPTWDDSFGKEIGQSSKYVPGIPPRNENIDLLQ